MILGIDASQANRKNRSGTEWYAFYLIREFKKFLGNRGDLKVRLYTRDRLQPDLAQELPGNFEVKILRWPFRYFWGQIRLSWEIWQNPPDILFCPAHTIPLIHPHPLSFNSSPPKGGEEGRGGKTFTTLHDVGFEDYPELYDFFSRWYHRWSARRAVKKVVHIFTVSEFSKDRILEYYRCPPEKITVTHLGIDQDFSAEKSWSIGSSKKKHILFVGRLEPKKNIFNIVRAYEMAEVEQDLVLAGKCVNIEEVEELLSSRPDNFRKKIKFLGYVAETEKAALYTQASIFLFPTLYEGFGLPILEAQAYGVPVITSNTGSNSEVAGRGALIVDPQSPYEISLAIKRLLTDERLRTQFIEAGKENLKRFDWSQTAQRTLQVMSLVD